jgi:hypothetical protein
MGKKYIGEKWKKVKFKVDFETDSYFEVSNLGRVRSFNRLSDGNILKGSLTEGYLIIRFKLYKPREQRIEKKLASLETKLSKLIKVKNTHLYNKASKKEIVNSYNEINALKKELKSIYAIDTKSREMHKHFLIHREVALAFLPKPKVKQVFVAHLDYDKLNNAATNLQWMTLEENLLHQEKNPTNIQQIKDRREGSRNKKFPTKLTIIKVMQLKKMLNQQKPMKQLVEKFKITETQVYRIKRGENWGDVEAAK